jgi:hypothetical protein
MSYVDKIKAMLVSRRFQATVASVLTVVFQDILGLTIEQSVMVVGIVQSWVVGDSITKTE